MAMAHTAAEVEHQNSAANHWSENNEQRRYPLTGDCHPSSSWKYTSWNRHDKSVYSNASTEAVISAPFNPAASGSAVSQERPIARSPPPPPPRRSAPRSGVTESYRPIDHPSAPRPPPQLSGSMSTRVIAPLQLDLFFSLRGVANCRHIEVVVIDHAYDFNNSTLVYWSSILIQGITRLIVLMYTLHKYTLSVSEAEDNLVPRCYLFHRWCKITKTILVFFRSLSNPTYTIAL